MNTPSRWSAKLPVSFSGLLAAEALTGLAITLLPFSPTTQAAVLAHTLLALPFAVVGAGYLARHLAETWRLPFTHHKLTGYLGLALTLALTVTGGLLTWQAAAAPRIDAFSRELHTAATWAALGVVGLHLGLVVARAVRARLLVGPGEPVRQFGARASLVAALGVAIWAAILLLAPRPSFDNRFPEGYGMPYGPDRPFAPSLARTETGGAFDAASLAGSERCGAAGCHDQIYQEWLPSAHRYAAMDPAFQVIQKTMAKQNGPESTRYCGGCHDPISLFSGTKNVLVDETALTSQLGYKEGISCIACHAIRETDVKGNAAYVAVQPQPYLFEGSPPGPGWYLADFLLRAHPDGHVAQYSRRMFKSPEFCAACHKQFIDEEVNQVGWVQLQNQYDNWRKSHWNHPGEADKTIECRECHMPLQDSTDPAAGDVADYNRTAGDAKHRSHRFLGANQWMPKLLKLENADEHVARTEAWMKGEVEVPEIAAKWATGAALSLQIEAPKSLSQGAPLDFKVTVHSNKVGHDFPTGPLDIIQAWVQLEVKDATGRAIYASGQVDAKHFIEPGTFMFKAEPVDQQGNLIDKHNLWEMVGVRYRRSLFPGFTDSASYHFEPPAGAPLQGPLTISARLLYRKFDQYLLNFTFGEAAGLTSPITPLATAEATIAPGGG